MDLFSATRIHRTWSIALSILPGAHVLTLHGMISDAVLLRDPRMLLIYYSSFIGMAFSMAFFAPLWSRLPLGTEGEFLLWRYRGRWADRLHAVRSALMSFFVIPYSMSLLLLPMQEMLAGMLGMHRTWAIAALGLLLLAGASVNSFSQRIRMDRLIGGAALVLTIPLLFLSVRGLRTIEPSALAADWGTWSADLSPADVIAPLLVIWWFAQIIDLPTMTGQKLLAGRNASAGSRGAVLASLGMVLIGGIFLAMPLSLGYTPDRGGYFRFLATALPDGPWLAILAAYYLCSGSFLLLNLQHWAGSLTDANLLRHHARMGHDRWTAMGSMLLTCAMGFAILLLQERTMDSFWERLLIAAGVGPVFILRWYLPRVTALVQFTAMIAAMAYAFLWHLLTGTAMGAALVAQCAAAVDMPLHLLQVGAIGVATLLTAAIPFWMAAPEDVAHGRERLRELHGGIPAIRRPFLVALGLCVAYLLLAMAPAMIGMLW